MKNIVPIHPKSRPSYLYNRNPYFGKMASLYQDGLLEATLSYHGIGCELFMLSNITHFVGYNIIQSITGTMVTLCLLQILTFILNLKQLETHGSLLNDVATDAPVLKHQVISSAHKISLNFSSFICHNVILMLKNIEK